VLTVLNRVLISPILKKTPYELFQGRKPNISHLKDFGRKCFILKNGKDNLGKFYSKSMRVYSLGIPCMVMHIKHIIGEPC